MGLGKGSAEEGGDETTEIETEREEGESFGLVGVVADLTP